MAAARALNSNSLLLFRLRSKNIVSLPDQSLHGAGGGSPILNFEEVMKEIQGRSVDLPLDMLESAKSIGIPKLFLLRYLSMQEFGWGLGFATRSCSMLRNQMMIDPWYPIQLGIKLASDVFMDFIAAAFMKKIGSHFVMIGLYLFFWMIFRIITRGVAFKNYGVGIINKKYESTSKHSTSMYADERSWSLIWAALYWSSAHFAGVIFSSSLMMRLYR